MPVIVSSGSILSGYTFSAFSSGLVEDGGMLRGSVVLSAANVTVASGGLAHRITIDDGHLTDSGRITDTLVENNGQLTVAGGWAVDLTVRAGGTITDSAGGVLEATSIGSGGVLSATSGPTHDTTVAFGGQFYTDHGLAHNTVVEGGAYYSQGPGTGDRGSHLELGADVQVLRGGELQDTGIIKGAVISAGGFAYLSAPYWETLQSGDPSFATLSGTIKSGGTVVVVGSGADLSGCVAESGARVILLAGGTESGLKLDRGATLETAAVAVYSAYGATQLLTSAGMTLSGTVLVGPENEYVYGGGVANGAQIGAGAYQWIESGGAESGTALNGGAQYVFDFGGVGDREIGTQINAGGFQYLNNGSGAVDTFVNSGGLQLLDDAVASNTTVNCGGLAVATFGAFDGLVVESGGMASISAYNTSNYGFATPDTVDVQSGGVLVARFETGTGSLAGTIENGGTLLLEPHEQASNGGLTVETGATVVLFGGTTLSGATVQRGVHISSAAVLVLSQFHQDRQGTYPSRYGSVMTSDVIGSGAQEFVYSGGIASATTILDGDQTLSGGSAISNTLGGDSLQVLSAGAVVRDEIVQNGGFVEEYDATDLISGITIDSGGFVAASPDTITNIALDAGATLRLSISFVAGASAILAPNDLLTISDGGQTYSLQMVGDYSGETFNVASRYSGIDITVSASAASAVAVASGELIPHGGYAVLSTAGPPPQGGPVGHMLLQALHFDFTGFCLSHLK